MEFSEHTLAEWLDPVTGRLLGEFAQLETVEVEGRTKVKVTLPYPLLESQRQQWHSALYLQEPLEDRLILAAEYPDATLCADPSSSLSRVKHCVAVASGKGGVGKSTVAVNLACALSALGLKVGLLDADIYGPSQGMMLGAANDQRPDVTNDRMTPVALHGVASMSMAYLVTENTPMVWRGPIATGALMQLLNQTLWGDLDVLLVDMPPGTGDIALTLAQKVPLSGSVVVTTPQDISLLDAKKGIEMFRKVNVPVLGLVENMSVHVCSECGHKDPVFGEGGGQILANQYDCSVLARTPLNREIREDVDEGRPTVLKDPDSALSEPFMRGAQRLLVALGEQGVLETPTIEVR